MTGFGALSQHTIATNATHYGGYAELDVQNMFGLMEEKTTPCYSSDISWEASLLD